ncbi:MAG: CAP domain-containing protein [Alphaproteobacteria bacterium]
MRVALTIFAVAFLAMAAGCQSALTGGAPAPTLSKAPATAGAIFTGAKKVARHDASAAKLINAYRARKGLGTVRVNSQLTSAAITHAKEIAGTQNISHYDANGQDPAYRARRAGYRFISIGENISAGRAQLGDVIKAWISSPAHEVNLVLSPAVDFGLAHIVAPGSKYTNYWVLVIGAPRPASALQMRIGG